jgi:response regulator RpfG family c-di-GMP phosphodiesterase
MNSKNKNISILYVDDELINLELFNIVFRSIFKVIIAESAEAGLKMLSTNPEIKIVISDMKMPGMNGIQFIKEAQKKYKHIVYYILTGYEITEEIQEAIEEKLIHKYFKKPFDKAELLNELNKVSALLD